MVGRFESKELRREARAHEENSAKLGPLSRCTCLFGTALTLAGLISPVLTINELASSSVASSTVVLEHAPPPDLLVEPPTPETYGVGYSEFERGYAHAREEPRRLGFDFSLLTLCGTVFALCVLPGLLRPSDLAPNWNVQSNPWSNGGPGMSGAGGSFAAMGYGAQDYNGRGRFYDPRAQGGAIWPQQPGTGPMDWTSSANGMGSWQGQMQQPFTGNSWLGSPSSPPSNGFGTGSSWSSSNFGSLGWGFLNGWGSGLGFGQTPGQQPGAVGALPNEAEVAETYGTFGVGLQQWVPSLTMMIDRILLEPLLQELDETDKLLQMFLVPRGWRLTTEAPRMAHMGIGIGPNVQELSVFDRHLPRPLSDVPQGVELWQRRQRTEGYLIHPSFEPAQRQYVLDRLRDWRQRGVTNAMHFNRRGSDQLPTDAHILENIVVQMLNFHLDFAGCFLSSGHAPPQAKHLGQAPVAFLRQVTDQNVFPKPPPHYEVVTLAKTYRIRPGNTNILEALAILMHALRKSNSRSYQSFPQILRNAIQ
mmetsp:Transcript_8309/g.19563  ORF Transcript_8309/g.19563 Transcript_8309/m.19563 type:complete len:533 (+) Transcript_8309:109-1707(+)